MSTTSNDTTIDDHKPKTVKAKGKDRAKNVKESHADMITRLYKSGAIDCKVANHFKADGTRQPDGYLLKVMPVGVTADCPCLRRACESVWPHPKSGKWQTEFIAPGSYRKGYGKVEGSVKRVECVPYTLTDEQREYLEKKFPGHLFVTTSDGYHDHPIAHISASLEARRVVEKLPKGTVDHPKRYIDLHGNPKANARVMRENPGVVIYTVVFIACPQDVIRKNTKWGPRVVGDHTMWYECSLRELPTYTGLPVPLSEIDGVLSLHTLYYYDFGEIARLMSCLRDGAGMHCMLHRHKGDRGSLNMGEQTWDRVYDNNHPWIHQVNSMTGERYSHKPMDAWFEHGSWTVQQDEWQQVGYNGLAWTRNMLSHECYYLLIMSCSHHVARASDNCYKLDWATPAATTPGWNAEKLLRHASISLDGYSVDIPHKYVRFIDELSVKAASCGYPYSAQKYESFKKRAVTLASGKNIPSDDLARCIVIGYWMNYKFNSDLHSGARYASRISMITTDKDAALADLLDKSMKFAGDALTNGVGPAIGKLVNNSTGAAVATMQRLV